MLSEEITRYTRANDALNWIRQAIQVAEHSPGKNYQGLTLEELNKGRKMLMSEMKHSLLKMQVEIQQDDLWHKS